MSRVMNGKVYVDAKRKTSVTISAADLAKAVPGDDHHCAVAEALRREKGVLSVSVGHSIVYVEHAANPGVIERFNWGPNERALIKTFDVQGAFPCGYRVTLHPPPASRKLGARKGERHGTNRRSGKGRNDALGRATRSRPTRHVSAPE